jgi:hypothetical protein
VIFIQPEITNQARSRSCGLFDCCIFARCDGFVQSALRRRQNATLVGSKCLHHPVNFAKSFFHRTGIFGAVSLVQGFECRVLRYTVLKCGDLKYSRFGFGDSNTSVLKVQ